jgi:hypothetical protein
MRGPCWCGLERTKPADSLKSGSIDGYRRWYRPDAAFDRRSAALESWLQAARREAARPDRRPHLHNPAARLLAALALPLLLAACGGQVDDQGNVDTADLEYGAYVHKLPMADAAAKPVNTASAHLTYYGGKVIQKVKVVKVQYGSGTYQSFIGAAGASSMAGFYSAVVNSNYMDWLVEYDTASPKQTISRGTYSGGYSITPSSTRNKATITDANIQAEISAQIAAGKLPAPDDNTLYMVHFPKGKTISQGGSKSCQAGGFCAYHGTFKRNSQDVFYGVLPDMSAGSGCDTGCGSGSAFGNQTSVASHELIEAVTDAEVGLATTVGKPLAWYDAANGEIGDICNAQQGSITSGSTTYTVQKEWSNALASCIVHK